jgi:Signal transduction histidine kinase
MDSHVLNPEVKAIFHRQAQEICTRVDKALAVLMVIQWFAAIVLAAVVSPNTWVGQFANTQDNVLLALVFGGLLAIPPMYCAWKEPGERLTRIVIAVSQMCFSILLIHLTGGRIETHFHIFVSLAFLAFYKDVSVLLIASGIVIVDHFLRGFYLPSSIYGSVYQSTGGFEWRWIEHAGWVIFEDIVLILGIHNIRAELWEMALSKYQLIKAREEAVRTSSLKSTFLSNMSHEIRTPLSSIIGFSDLLRDTELEHDQRQYVGTIHRCGESLLRIINDILDFSKIENGVMTLDRHHFDLREIHQDIKNMFLAKCWEKGLELEVRIDERVPTNLVGDSYRIRQVLTNLVGNAVKFTDKGKVIIEVKVDVDKSVYRWTVKDTGMGINYEKIQTLFKAFSQEDASIQRRYGGTGLGLMISKNLVELMNGQIAVDSQVGVGTTFYFSLPLEKV